MRSAFRIYAAALLFFYFALAWSGWGFGAGRRGHVPPGVRQSPGGYRSYYFWRGGK